jgi:hypothetical protein
MVFLLTGATRISGPAHAAAHVNKWQRQFPSLLCGTNKPRARFMAADCAISESGARGPVTGETHAKNTLDADCLRGDGLDVGDRHARRGSEPQQT